MEPFPLYSAIEWEFRCQGREIPGLPWDWRCRSQDGAVLAQSQRYFRTLREAVADAAANGFQDGSLPPESAGKRATKAHRAQ